VFFAVGDIEAACDRVRKLGVAVEDISRPPDRDNFVATSQQVSAGSGQDGFSRLTAT